jgi:N-acetylglucosamine-6-phosphate deacetylase
VVVEDDVIIDVTRSIRDGDLPPNTLDVDIVSPGFVDLQVNGGFGFEVEANPETLEVIERRLPESGVTSYLPTVISAEAAFYESLFARWEEDSGFPGARRIGVHLEGPFLSPERKGAHSLKAINAADAALFERFMDSFDVTLVTIAPERPGNLDRIKRLRDAEVTVSLGHTNATADQLLAGVDAGATMATHLFNAMSAFNHRDPGAIGAILTEDRLVAGLIVDGVHAHPRSIELAVRAKGVDRIALVTDMMAAAGMPAGAYTLGGQRVETDGRSVHLADGTLAGSVLLMDEAIRNLVDWTTISAGQAIRMATEIPAALIGRDDIGCLRPGAFADLTVLDRNLNVLRTIVDGLTVYSRSAAKQ